MSVTASRKLTGEYYACEYCGKATYRMPSLAARVNHIFCSVDCKFNYRRGRKVPHQTGIKHPRWAGSRFCKICGIELFERRQRQVLNCKSTECLHESKTRNRSGAQNGRWLGGEYPNCKQCGKQIVSPNRLRRTFCSRACSGQWQSENLSGPNSHLWKGVRKGFNDEYPPEWTYTLRLKIRRRDDFTCQNCGKHQRGLDVHHIDKDKENCDPSNLISLCRSCHRYIEGGSIPCPRPAMLSVAV
jgi:hypothetical protein